MAVLYPKKEDFALVYQQLEDLAGNKRLIQTTTDGPSLGLVVSDEVFDRWVDAQTTDTEKAAPKKVGRPRKTQES
jgi:hypothetical protein